jgi:phosphoribosylglycinamide formyltransferase-1
MNPTDSKRPTIAILASGSGSTAEAFIRAGAEGRIDAQAGLIICNNPKAGIYERISNLNAEFDLDINAVCISKLTHPTNGEIVAYGEQTHAEEAAIIDLLSSGNFSAIALMGYMKRIGPRLVHEFGWRSEYQHVWQAKMVNTHPGLLPASKGLYGIHVQEHVLANKLPYSGQTLHVVAEDYDDGPTVAEHKVKVKPDDTPASLFDRVQADEKRYLPLDVDAFIKLRQEKSHEIVL